jgi:hypothetical protein
MGQRKRRACRKTLGLPVERRDQILGDHLSRISLLGNERVQAIAQSTGLGRPVDHAVEIGHGF